MEGSPTLAEQRPSDHVFLAEYAAVNQIYLAYDGFRWQAGSFLIAGVFVFWGFVISAVIPTSVVTVASLLVACLMTCWILFASHYRQLYLWKLARAHEIEKLLGMEQHLRFTNDNPSGSKVKAMGPAGHNIDFAVYVLTSLGGSVLVWARDGWSWWPLLTIPLIVGAGFVVALNERRARSARKNALVNPAR